MPIMRYHFAAWRPLGTTSPAGGSPAQNETEMYSETPHGCPASMPADETQLSIAIKYEWQNMSTGPEVHAAAASLGHVTMVLTRWLVPAKQVL